jgi:hypothetical protein
MTKKDMTMMLPKFKIGDIVIVDWRKDGDWMASSFKESSEFISGSSIVQGRVEDAFF